MVRTWYETGVQESQGKGIATLFDGDGNLHRKIRYLDGKPVEE